MLLEKAREKIIEKQYVIDSMAEKAACFILRLLPYHCILNPIKIMWNQLEYQVCHLNVYASQPSKVVDLIRNVSKEYTVYRLNFG